MIQGQRMINVRYIPLSEDRETNNGADMWRRTHTLEVRGKCTFSRRGWITKKKVHLQIEDAIPRLSTPCSDFSTCCSIKLQLS